MKLQFTILFVLIVSISKAQVLSDSSIRKSNISQIIIKTSNKTKNGFHTLYTTRKTVTTYNRYGKPIKSVQVSYDAHYKSQDSSIIEFFYLDTVISATNWKEFEGRKLMVKGSEKYTYTFDTINRMTSQLLTDNGGHKTKEEYIWNSSNRIEEIVYYSNDSAIYVPQRRGYDFLLGKGLQLNRVVRNYWSTENNLLKSVECKIGCRLKYISDSLCCTSTEYSSNKDTLTQKIRFYNEGWQTVFEKEYSMPSGAIYQESQRGDKTLTFKQKNKKGLLTKQESYEMRIEGSILETITTYAYKFNFR